jgi:hypothetical protein
MRATALAPVLIAVWLPASLAASQGASALEQTGTLTDRYLTVGEAREVLHAANQGFGLCFQEHAGVREPGDVSLKFTVARDGRPLSVRVEIDEEFAPLGECLEQVAADLRYDAHDGDPMDLAYPIVFVRDDRGPRTVPYPIVFVRPRERTFLFVHVPPSLDPAARQRLSGWLYP